MQRGVGGAHDPSLPIAKELWTMDGCSWRESPFSLKMSPLVGCHASGWPHAHGYIGSTKKGMKWEGVGCEGLIWEESGEEVAVNMIKIHHTQARNSQRLKNNVFISKNFK